MKIDDDSSRDFILQEYLHRKHDDLVKATVRTIPKKKEAVTVSLTVEARPGQSKAARVREILAIVKAADAEKKKKPKRTKAKNETK